jgi:hypothetical protein
MRGANCPCALPMQVCLSGTTAFCLYFLVQKSLAGTGRYAAGCLQLARGVKCSRTLPKPACNVLADPADSYGPANGYMAYQHINADVDPQPFLTLQPAAPLLSLASPQLSYSQPFRPSPRRLWSTKLRDRSTTLAVSPRQILQSMVGHNHDQVGRPQRKPARWVDLPCCSLSRRAWQGQLTCAYEQAFEARL